MNARDVCRRLKRQEYFKVACMTRRWVDLVHVRLLVGQVLASPSRFSRFGYVKKREKRGECQVPGPYPFPVPPVHQPDERSQRKKARKAPQAQGKKIQVGQI